MQQGPSKTPCRRIGLRRIPSTSKSGLSPALTLSLESSTGFSDTPNSCKVSKKLEKIRPVRNLLSDIHAVPSKSSPAKVEGISSSAELSIQSSSDASAQQPSSRKEPLLDFDYCDSSSNVTKKQKTNLSVTPPTMADWNALQRNVILKEKHLKELRQADIIRKKVINLYF